LPSGNIISLTEKGKKILLKRRNELNRIFSVQKPFQIAGKVKSGLGEGKYYINLPGYQKQFKEKLGGKVFPGTLNLEVNEFELADFLSSKKGVFIEGFSGKQRSFGSAFVFRVKLNGLSECFAIVPERTTHPKNILEIISFFNLRKKLKLKDNDVVFVS
jgi:riboflavin kinase